MDNVGSVTYNATNHKWLRLRHSSGNVYWDTSADGVNWTNQASAAVAEVIPLTALRVQFVTGYSGTESPTTVIFDNVNLVPALANPAFSGTGALTVTRYQKFAVSKTLTGSGSLTATTQAKFSVSKTLTGTGSLTAATKKIAPVTVTLSGHGVLTATASPKFAVIRNLPGVGTLTVTEYQKFAVIENLPGTGAFAATYYVKIPVAKTLPGTGVLTAAITYLGIDTFTDDFETQDSVKWDFHGPTAVSGGYLYLGGGG